MKVAALLSLISSAMAYRYVAYYTAWSTYGRNFQVSDIPVDKITHINYAFGNIGSDGKLILGDSYADIDKAFSGDSWDTSKQPFRGNFWQLLKVVKQKYPNIKILISIGGWTWSGKFSDVALTDASRAIFVKSVVDFVKLYGFDGVDVDWEYPVEGGLPANTYRPADGQNYNLLLKALREGLDTIQGTSKQLLTIAAPAGPHITRHLIIPEMAKYVDWINIMTYDFRGGWSKYTGHQTPLYPPKASASMIPSDDPDKVLTETQSVVDYFLKQGMPSTKICIGAAFYGRGWAGVKNTNNGLYQTFTSVPKGTWDDGTSGNTGVFDYKDVKAKVASGQLTRYWDGEVKAPYAFSASSGLMISYEDSQSIGEKIKYLKSKNLAGIMIWDLSSDDKGELSGVIYSQLVTDTSGPTDTGSGGGGTNNGSGNQNGGASASANSNAMSLPVMMVLVALGSFAAAGLVGFGAYKWSQRKTSKAQAAKKSSWLPF